MIRKGWPLAVVVALTLARGADVFAQGPPPDEADAVPLRVEVTISRYQDDEPTGSRPYVLALVAEREGGARSSLAVDARLPESPDLPPGLHHQNVGTAIFCTARNLGAGRYLVGVGIEESSIDRRSIDTAPVSAVFLSFTSDNTLVLRDGQSRRYAAAVDRVTGATIRVDVTLNVLDRESAP